MADATQIDPAIFEQAGATVADSLDRAAQPARVPLAMMGTSPADAAAGALASAMSTKVAAASAELAPRGPKIRAASATAAAGFRTTDEDNAALLQAVPASGGESAMGGNPATGATGRIQMVSDGWDDPAEPWKIPHDWEEGEDGNFYPPIQINPGAAGGGGYGRPPV